MSAPRMTDDEFQVEVENTRNSDRLISEAQRARESETVLLKACKYVLAAIERGEESPATGHLLHAIAEASGRAEEMMANAERKMDDALRTSRRAAGYCPEHRLDQPHKDCPACNPEPTLKPKGKAT